MPVIRNNQSRFTENLIKNLEKQQPLKEASKVASYEEKNASQRGNSIFNEMAEAKKRDYEMRSFIKSVKETFLGECLNKIYSGSLSRIMMESEMPVNPTQLIASYIQEKGVDNLLMDMRYKSVLLSEMSQLVEKYSLMTLEDCKDAKDCKAFKVPEETKDAFYDELDMQDTDDVVFQISDRVNGAIDEFINTNTLNKLNIKEILQSSQEKIQSTKNDVQRESVERVAGRAVHSIKNDGRVGILTAMVERSAKSIMGNDVLRESYMDGTKLDMERIVNSCKMSYTLMEMTNAIKLETFTEESILEFLKAI